MQEALFIQSDHVKQSKNAFRVYEVHPMLPLSQSSSYCSAAVQPWTLYHEKGPSAAIALRNAENTDFMNNNIPRESRLPRSVTIIVRHDDRGRLRRAIMFGA